MIREQFDADSKAPESDAPQKREFKALRLTSALVGSVGEVIQDGLPVESVPDLFGVARSVWRSWLHKGEQYLAASSADDVVVDADELCARLALAVRKARAEYERRRVAVLHVANNREWRKEISILERRFRRNWALVDPDGGDEDAYTPDERFL